MTTMSKMIELTSIPHPEVIPKWLEGVKTVLCYGDEDRIETKYPEEYHWFFGDSVRNTVKTFSFNIDEAYLKHPDCEKEIDSVLGYAEEEKQTAETLAPVLWKTYKDVLDEEALAALRDVIENQSWEMTSFIDTPNIEDSFKWARTTQGVMFWHNVNKGQYNNGYSESIPTGQVANLTNDCAADFLKRAASLQEERAKEYDQDGGERSAGKIAAAFNAITGHSLTESDVWMLLVVLKQVRFYNNPSQRHRDSVEDMVSYSALFAESVFK